MGTKSTKDANFSILQRLRKKDILDKLVEMFPAGNSLTLVDSRTLTFESLGSLYHSFRQKMPEQIEKKQLTVRNSVSFFWISWNSQAWSPAPPLVFASFLLPSRVGQFNSREN